MERIDGREQLEYTKRELYYVKRWLDCPGESSDHVKNCHPKLRQGHNNNAFDFSFSPGSESQEYIWEQMG